MYYLGVDLGGTNIAVGIVNEQGNLLLKKTTKTLANRDFREIVKDMADLSFAACLEYGISIDDIKSVGIGSPGVVDSENGVVIYSNNIVMVDVPIAEEFKKHINKPVYMNNDANCAALGEVICGAARGKKNAVMITLGTGVGGGIIIDGKIYEGKNNLAGEVGHTVIVVDGYDCTCGRKGCFEAYSSATGLIKMTKQAISENQDKTIMWDMIEHDLTKTSGKTAFKAAREGDVVAASVVNKYIKYLAVGIVNVANSFRPEIIIIGGGVCNEGEYLLAPLRDYVDKYCFGAKYVKAPELVAAELGNNAGIIGAALLELQI